MKIVILISVTIWIYANIDLKKEDLNMLLVYAAVDLAIFYILFFRCTEDVNQQIAVVLAITS